jgi:hypothetical protein
MKDTPNWSLKSSPLPISALEVAILEAAHEALIARNVTQPIDLEERQ